eukprot:2372143-Pyramimonas_sp.AAC.1
MNSRHKYWQNAWTDKVDTMENIVYEIGQTLRMAKKQGIDPITLEGLENALARMSANKAKGVDTISVNDIARLPVSGKQMLVDFLNRAEA